MTTTAFTISLLSLYISHIFSETLTFNSTNPVPSDGIIQCQDANSPCIINCVSQNACKSDEIHCHATSTHNCTINLIGKFSAQKSTIYTHNSSTIRINGIGYMSCESCTIYAHSRLGAKFYLHARAIISFRSSILYSPIGENSLLYMTAFDRGCRDMQIYDDYTTTVYMEGFDGYYQFYNVIVRNIFDDNNSTLNISRSDDAYIGLNINYRGSVTLNNCDHSSTVFKQMKYYGHNHGHWLIEVTGNYALYDTFIYATADDSLLPYGDIDGYNITVIGTGHHSTNDNLTGNAVAMQLTLDANQRGANVFVDVTDKNGFKKSKITARKANSVSLYCREGGDCYDSVIECPESEGTDSETVNDGNSHIAKCRIYCDADSDTSCTNMQIYTHNGYCDDVAVLCSEDGCYKLDGTQIYCGYNQTLNYCTLEESDGTFECIDYQNRSKIENGFCSNNITEPQCRNYTRDLGVVPIRLNDLEQRKCTDFPTWEPTLSPTTDPTTNPSSAPTMTPTTAPTMSPTIAPTVRPTAYPTEIPTKHPSQVPTVGLAAEVYHIEDTDGTSSSSNMVDGNGKSVTSEQDSIVAALADATILMVIAVGAVVCCVFGCFMERLYRKLRLQRAVELQKHQMDQKQIVTSHTGHVPALSYSSASPQSNQFAASISKDHLGTMSYDGNMTGLTGSHERNVSGLGQLSVPPIISMSPAMSAVSVSGSSPHSGNLHEEDGHIDIGTDIFMKSTSGMELEFNESAANSHITGGMDDEEVVGDEHDEDLEGATDQGVDGHFYNDEAVLVQNELRTPKSSEDDVVEHVVMGKGIRASSDSEIYIEPDGNFRSSTMRTNRLE